MEKHDLLHEFPEYREKIHLLKIENQHFRQLFDVYDQLDHEIYRINAGIEIVNDDAIHKLKTKLLFIKDEIFSMLENN